MTDWKIVYGSQTEKPAEFDTESSPTVAYQRRNIQRVKDSESESEFWKYEEREMTHAEAIKVQLTDTMSKISNVEETSTTGLLAITDLYEQLINKGVL